MKLIAEKPFKLSAIDRMDTRPSGFLAHIVEPGEYELEVVDNPSVPTGVLKSECRCNNMLVLKDTRIGGSSFWFEATIFSGKTPGVRIEM